MYNKQMTNKQMMARFKERRLMLTVPYVYLDVERAQLIISIPGRGFPKSAFRNGRNCIETVPLGPL